MGVETILDQPIFKFGHRSTDCTDNLGVDVLPVDQLCYMMDALLATKWKKLSL